MRILVAEDDKASQQLMKRILEPAGDVVVVEDGKEALDAFVGAHNEEKPFDVMFLDVMMPALDGQETLRLIREEEEKRGILGLEGIKIVMVTALGDRENVLGAFKTGAEGYLVKPVNKEKILTQLDKIKKDYS